ncbi:uncharacterized protein Fot_32584 [Forsythia ovata]|uniref:Uncharacterized protein n=1 Tax=Forsythia ovata TaxID=205694 RepID=A0ABD1T894_9LAMI
MNVLSSCVTLQNAKPLYANEKGLKYYFVYLKNQYVDHFDDFHEYPFVEFPLSVIAIVELGADAAAVDDNDNDTVIVAAMEEGAKRLVIALNCQMCIAAHQKPHHLYHPTSINSLIYLDIFQDFRQYSVDTDKQVDKINLKFVEARDDIEAAMESKETMYFDEEVECVRASVNEVLEMYERLLKTLPDNQRSVIQRAMGLKIEQLKAELAQLNED